MNSFPAYFPLAGRRVVIVGDGEAAEAKARLFDGSPAQVLRLDAVAGADPAAYAQAVLAFVAVADEAQAQAAALAARAARVPVNVVDRPGLCDFTTPAVIDRQDVVIAIGTGGAAPLMASLLRGAIEAQVPPGAGRVAALLGSLQQPLRAAFPDLAQRRAFLRAALGGPAAEAALAGDMAAAEALLRAAIAAAEPAPGTLRLVDGAGPADRLTLRAARALGEADLLVVDADAAPAVVTLARRDAPRITARDMDHQAVRAAVDAGRQVVWITAPGAAESVAAALQADGLAPLVLPQASA